MRTHRDGYIQTNKLEIWLPKWRVRSAQQYGHTRMAGLAREVEQELGIELSEAERFRVIERDDENQMLLVRIESSWVRPSRS